MDPGPASPRTAKAGLFRAKSPPIILDRSSANGTARIRSPDALMGTFAQMNGNAQAGPSRYSPDQYSQDSDLRRPNPLDGQPYASSVGTLGHTPIMVDRDQLPSNGDQATHNAALLAGVGGIMNGDTETAGLTGGSDDMLMSLLAGQAAVDCEQFGVGGWEEVEGWKKELAILANRLDSLVARHQREIKILTAARTLQKLNTTNKRMSKQTTESLEQAEKRADAAEREVLMLKEREGDLRKRLMEHWAGVMAWEVRRLEKVSSETQARFNRQSRQIGTSKEKETEMLRQMGELETHLDRRGQRINELESQSEKHMQRTKELEEIVLELGRRERGIEEECRNLEKVKRGLEVEKDGWEMQRKAVERDAQNWEKEKRGWQQEKEEWSSHKRLLAEEMERLMKDRQRMLDQTKISERDRGRTEGLRVKVGAIMGKAPVAADHLDQALDDIRMTLNRREQEVLSLKGQLRESADGLEDEIRRMTTDRDNWKTKAEKAETSERGCRGEIAALDRRLKGQKDEISDMTLRNESLSTSLNAAQSAVQSLGSSSSEIKALKLRNQSLTTELDSIAGQFNEVWTILPPLTRRVEAQLATPDGSSNGGIASPSKSLNFNALQFLYKPTDEPFSGIDEMLNRIRGMVDDGKILVERVIRLGQEREMYKTNAAKAKKLVEDSRGSLETYQQQVAVLEDRLAKTGASEGHFLEELNTLRGNLDAANATKRQLEVRARQQSETVERLEKANTELSTRALTLADDAESQRSGAVRKVQAELEAMKKQMAAEQEDADEERARGQAQRIQLLDELNSLQAEVGDLRKQLRIAKGGK